MPKGYGLGIGIASGARAFVDSYMQAKQMKQQEKLQQNAYIIQVLTRTLEDENVPYRERAKILDSIPQLLGVKNMPRSLSQMTGLDEFINKQVDNPQTPLTPAIPEQKAQVPTTLEGTPLFPREAVPEGALGNVGTISQGDLTPAILKRKLILEQKRAEDVGDIEKAKKIAQFQFDLQEKSYKANGYRITSEGTNDQGEYVQVLTNNAGDQKINKLPSGFKPLKVQVAEARINRPSTFIREQEDYYISQGFSEEEANKKALADANERYQLKKRTGEAYATSIEQGISGTKPPTASAKMSNEDRDRAVQLQLQKDFDVAQSALTQVNTRVSALEKEKADAATESSIAKNEFDKLVASGDVTPSDQAYKDAKTNANNKLKRYHDLEAEYRKAIAEQSAARETFNAANSRRGSFGGTPTQTQTAITPALRRAIDIVRKNNPDQTATMSDEDIINYLKANGKIR